MRNEPQYDEMLASLGRKKQNFVCESPLPPLLKGGETKANNFKGKNRVTVCGASQFVSMKRKYIVLLVTLIFLIAGFILLGSQLINKDRCLDRGGSWEAVTWTCDL